MKRSRDTGTRGSPAKGAAEAAPREQRPYHHGDLRRALVSVGLEIVSREGLEALSLREVARRVGVSYAAPYRHFSDRSALLAALAEEGFRELLEELRGASEAAAAGLERVQATGASYLRFALRRPAHFRVMFSPELAEKSAHPGLQSASLAAHALLVGIAREALGEGHSEQEVQDAALAGWALAHGLATLWLEGPLSHPAWGLELEPAVKRMMELVARGAAETTAAARR